MGAVGRARGSPASVHGGQREGYALEEQEHEESLAGRAVAYALSILAGLGGWGWLRNPATRLGGTGWHLPGSKLVGAARQVDCEGPSRVPERWAHTYLPGGWARAQKCQFRA